MKCAVCVTAPTVIISAPPTESSVGPTRARRAYDAHMRPMRLVSASRRARALAASRRAASACADSWSPERHISAHASSSSTAPRARAHGRDETRAMVLYDAMVLLSAKVPKSACADVLRRLGTQVMDRGGVVTDVVSYGARTLAYEFRKPGEKHFEVRGARVRAARAAWAARAVEAARVLG